LPTNFIKTRICLYKSLLLLKHRHECIGGMGILGARRFNFVQRKSLGSHMAPPKGLTVLHSDIKGNA